MSVTIKWTEEGCRVNGQFYYTWELLDSIVPGLCRACGFEISSVEPDAEGYNCPECDKDTVDSIPVIIGVI